MVLSVKSGESCADQACSVGTGRGFTLSVDIVTAPSEGYTGAQSWVNFGDDLVYKPAARQSDEIVWPDCEPGAAVRSLFSLESVNHGCVTGLISPLPSSSYTGNFVDLSFNCSSGPSSTLVRLLPLGVEPADTSGSGFITPSDGQVAANVSDLTIDCVDGLPTSTPTALGGPTSTPTSPQNGTPSAPTATPDQLPTGAPPGPGTPAPSVVPGATPTDTPLSTGTPATPAVSFVGDASCDGRVDPLDAALILQLAAGLTPALPCSNRGDANGDGITNPLDAALILQFSAGLINRLPP
jgi:hypothetical protein